MDKDLSPPGSPLMVLLQGLSELPFSACFLCIAFLTIPGLFSIMFTCPPKRRPEVKVESDVVCQIRLTVENRRREEARSFIIP